MRLRYDEDFVEAAVQVCTTRRGPEISSLQVARFNREREKLYDILDPDERNTAFFRLHLDWFREWGLERRLTEPLKVLRPGTAPISPTCWTAPLGAWKNEMMPPRRNWSVTVLLWLSR